jgi:hypothetical protein
MSRICRSTAAAEPGRSVAIGLRVPLRRLAGAAGGALLLAVASCVRPAITGSIAIPPIPAGEARLWIYRGDEPYAGKGLPAVAANGRYLGQAELGGAFYRDLPPGHYRVTVETYGIDLNQAADFDLAAGRAAYVKIVSNPSWVSYGIETQIERPTFYAWLIPSETAQADVGHLSFYGGS